MHAVDVIDANIAGSLARDLGPSRFGQVLDSFAADAARLTEQVEEAIRTGDAVTLRQAAHALAGAAAAVGAVSLERLARSGLGPGPHPPGFVAALRQAAQATLRALRAVGAGQAPP
jgi:Hpt domain